MKEHDGNEWGNENFPSWPSADRTKLLRKLQYFKICINSLFLGREILFYDCLTQVCWNTWNDLTRDLNHTMYFFNRQPWHKTKEQLPSTAATAKLPGNQMEPQKQHTVSNKDATLWQVFRKQHNSSISKYLSHYLPFILGVT